MEQFNADELLASLLSKAGTTFYRGIDPYDFASAKLPIPRALKPKLSFLNKISPINFRPLLGIRASENSKSNALFMHAMVNCRPGDYQREIEYLFKWFDKNKSPQFNEFSVGFAFEMTLTRYQSGPGKTSLIITLFTLFAFMAYYEKTGNAQALDAILSFERLLDTQWLRYETDTELWYSYLPDVKDEVYNATAKCGRFYALLQGIQPNDRYLRRMEKILAYLARVQQADGTWGYSVKAPYVDNFHTVFMLESIAEMNKWCASPASITMFNNGLATYRQHCFDGWRPLHFHTAHQPRDVRSRLLQTEIRDAANAIILFSKLGDTQAASGIIHWLLQHYYNSRKKYFYFFDNKLFKSKIDFIRWQAWMALALSEYLKPPAMSYGPRAARDAKDPQLAAHSS
jgi:hypothetical protein